MSAAYKHTMHSDTTPAKQFQYFMRSTGQNRMQSADNSNSLQPLAHSPSEDYKPRFDLWKSVGKDHMTVEYKNNTSLSVLTKEFYETEGH